MTDKNLLDFFGDWSEVINFTLLQEALAKVEADMVKYSICPDVNKVFNAFRKCPLNELKVVCIFQDPYPQKGIATGIALANEGDLPYDKMSPSLRVFFQSIDKYIDDFPEIATPNLEYLEEQGVLMLNSALTVRTNWPGSHSNIWRRFIVSLLENIQNRINPIFVFFGSVAQSFIPYVMQAKTICSPHPAFCARNNTLLPDIFNDINGILAGQNKQKIRWK